MDQARKDWLAQNRPTRPREGFIYAASNGLFPGILKLGMTAQAPEARIKTMCGTAPTPYTLEYFTAVTDRFKAERYVFRRLQTCRIDPRKEFFRITVTNARAVMDLAEAECRGLPLREIERALRRAFA